MNEKRIVFMRSLHENHNTCSQVVIVPHIYVEPSMITWVSDAGNIKIRWSAN